MIIDLVAAARRPPAERTQAWLVEQRVFISSAMNHTAAERRAVADAVAEEGSRAVWFEEFGRDADPEEAYLGELESATIYIGILRELYGRQLRSGFSATETEYLRARELGKRTNVFVAEAAPAREGHLNRFIERVRVFLTTEPFSTPDDLARRVRRRLQELAAEALSPWVKLDELVFRADEIEDTSDSVTIRAQVNEEIAHRLQAMHDQQYARSRLRLTYGQRVLEGDLVGLRTTTRATAPSGLTIELGHCTAPRGDGMRAGTGGHSADELVAIGMRNLFLGEPVNESIGMLGFLADTGIDTEALRECFDLPNEVAEAITRLVVCDGLVRSGRAARITKFALGPRTIDRDARRIAIEWEESRAYVNVEPQRRSIEGEWQRP